MPSMNRVELMGNLTRDPETRTTPTGKAVCKLGVAVNRKFKTPAGELKEVVGFFDVEAWGVLGEQCEKYLRKGRPVLVEGRLQHDRWKTSQGESRSKLRITAQRVHFLGSRDRGGAGMSDASAAGGSRPPVVAQDEEPGDGGQSEEEGGQGAHAGAAPGPLKSETDLPF